jgi:hypothetical protein
LLDPQEGLVGYPYSYTERDSINNSLFVYNYKEDRMVYESPPGFSITPRMAIDSQYALSWRQQLIAGNKNKVYQDVFYNWRTGEIVENDLTEAIFRHRITLLVRPCRNISLTRRYAFGSSDTIGKVKLTWDRDYSDVKIIPLDYLLPRPELGFSDFILSADGAWASCLVWGYRGLRNNDLCKRAFFHLDERYPNGISIPVITDDYESYGWDYSAFVQHPVHGMCFAQEWHKEGQLYLRLYKMSEVLAEINRQMVEKGE